MNNPSNIYKKIWNRWIPREKPNQNKEMKIADSVLLSLFMRENEKCKSLTPASTGISGFYSQYSMNWSQWSRSIRKNITTLRWSRGDFFTAATPHFNTHCFEYENFEKSRSLKTDLYMCMYIWIKVIRQQLKSSKKIFSWFILKKTIKQEMLYMIIIDDYNN